MWVKSGGFACCPSRDFAKALTKSVCIHIVRYGIIVLIVQMMSFYMAKISVSDAREDFSEVVNQVCYSGARIVLHRRGKDIVALVPVSDLEMLESLEDAMDIDAAKAAIKETKKKGSTPWNKLKKELGLK